MLLQLPLLFVRIKNRWSVAPRVYDVLSACVTLKIALVFGIRAPSEE